MSCSNCTPPLPTASFVFNPNTPCNNCDSSDCQGGVKDSHCVNYSGPSLVCSGISSNDRLDLIIQKIDTKMCTISGVDPFPTYNTYCLSPTNTQKDFVEKISQGYCTLLGDFNTFTSTTFPSALSAINTRIDNLDLPNITSCSQIGIGSADSIKVTLQKISDAVCNIYSTSLNISSVNWGLCSTVSTPPVTLVDGFNFVIGRICALQASGGSGTLPTFDNTGTCLPTPVTTTDSLYSTVIKIRTRLCQTPTFNPSSYNVGCIAISGSSTLDQVLQALINQTTQLSQNIPNQFDSSQFTVVPVDNSNPCLGKKISLVAGASADRLVAINSGDSTPGTLDSKLAAGSGISLDFGTINAGKVTISTSGVFDTYKVKSDTTDTTPDFLINKVIGNVDTISIITALSGNQVKVKTSVDYTDLATRLIDTITNDVDLKAAFCALVASCPSPCTAPTNVTVTYTP